MKTFLYFQFLTAKKYKIFKNISIYISKKICNYEKVKTPFVFTKPYISKYPTDIDIIANIFLFLNPFSCRWATIF